MKITIEYCVVWNYFPKAASLAEAISNSTKNADIEMIKSSGGAFEINKDGELIFSKHKMGRFPEEEEIIQKVK